MEANKFVVNMKANKFVVNMKANKFTKEKEKQSLELFHITLKYIIFCYQELKKDNKNYSRSLCETTESSEFEDYLKMEFVDDYLQKLKGKFKNIAQQHKIIRQIKFNYETVKRYWDKNGIRRRNKIDIFISNLGLANDWNISDEDLFFAVECKIVEKIRKETSSSKNYITDIRKYVERKYKFHFPFAGMIGFLEKGDIVDIVNDINVKLEKLNEVGDIETYKILEFHKIEEKFQFSYLSNHKKIENSPINIYHLFFDY